MMARLPVQQFPNVAQQGLQARRRGFSEHVQTPGDLVEVAAQAPQLVDQQAGCLGQQPPVGRIAFSRLRGRREPPTQQKAPAEIHEMHAGSIRTLPQRRQLVAGEAEI